MDDDSSRGVASDLQERTLAGSLPHPSYGQMQFIDPDGRPTFCTPMPVYAVLHELKHAITYRSRLSCAVQLVRTFAAKHSGDADEADVKAARQWLQQLDPDTIPRDVGEVSFSRSSGPGGQNVNK